MSQDQQHFDVASYALGVLDQRDADRFEAHLVDCHTCAIELESMLPVVDILADIDADSLVATEQSRRDGLVLNRMIGAVGQERRRAHSRRLFSLAAAVVAFAVLGVGAAFAGAQWFGTSANSTVAEKPTLPPLPPDDPGRGGPGEGNAARLGKTDARTGVRAEVGLIPKDYGTQVNFAISNLKGPLTCQLVAVKPSGESVVLSTWKVGEKGWGTAEQPASPELVANTVLTKSEIAYVQVQALDANGRNPQTLVAVP
jgi:hypothetical protein